MAQKSSLLAGMVLAGGASSRFGSEKAMATLLGRPLLSWSIANLAAVASRIAVNAPAGSGAAVYAQELHLPVLEDQQPSIGPLCGVLSGLIWAQSMGADWLVCLPCDVPIVPRDALQRMMDACANTSGAYAQTSRGIEGLCSIWPIQSKKTLASLLARGSHPAVQTVLATLKAVRVAFDADDALFQNINCPSDLRRLEARLASPRGSAGSPSTQELEDGIFENGT
jgi:molybdopterin-guanine dinucleotide biosynthesis protein A